MLCVWWNRPQVRDYHYIFSERLWAILCLTRNCDKRSQRRSSSWNAARRKGKGGNSILTSRPPAEGQALRLEPPSWLLIKSPLKDSAILYSGVTMFIFQWRNALCQFREASRGDHAIAEDSLLPIGGYGDLYVTVKNLVGKTRDQWGCLVWCTAENADQLGICGPDCLVKESTRIPDPDNSPIFGLSGPSVLTWHYRTRGMRPWQSTEASLLALPSSLVCGRRLQSPIFEGIVLNFLFEKQPREPQHFLVWPMAWLPFQSHTTIPWHLRPLRDQSLALAYGLLPSLDPHGHNLWASLLDGWPGDIPLELDPSPCPAKPQLYPSLRSSCGSYLSGLHVGGYLPDPLLEARLPHAAVGRLFAARPRKIVASPPPESLP